MRFQIPRRDRDIEFCPSTAETRRGREGQTGQGMSPGVPLCPFAEGQGKARNFNGFLGLVPLVPQFHKELNELKRNSPAYPPNARHSYTRMGQRGHGGQEKARTHKASGPKVQPGYFRPLSGRGAPVRVFTLGSGLGVISNRSVKPQPSASHIRSM